MRLAAPPGKLKAEVVSSLDMTWEEVGEAAGRGSIVIVPVGSTEQHGPHLPLGVDGYIPMALAREVALRLPAIVAPPIWYAARSAPHSGGGRYFPGTTSVRGRTLEALLGDVLTAFRVQGWRGAAVFNGHFENSAFIAEAATAATAAGPETANRPFRVCAVNWWEMVSAALLQELFEGDFPGWELEHASLTETSLMQHFYPALVRGDRIPPPGPAPRQAQEPLLDVFPEPRGLVPPTGVLFRADTASAARGRRLAAHLVDRIEEALRREYGY